MLRSPRSLEEFVEDLFCLPNTQPTMIWNEIEIDAAQLQNMVTHFTAVLYQRGIGPGKRVGIMLPNRPEVIALFYAAAKLGGAIVPFFPAAPDMAASGFFSKFAPDLIITMSERVTTLVQTGLCQGQTLRVVALEELNREETTDIIVASVVAFSETLPMIFGTSSGTTGIPKPIIISRENAASIIRIAGELTRSLDPTRSDKQERCMLAFPLSSIGLLVILGILKTGVVQVFSEDISVKRYLELAKRWDTGILSAPPAYLEALLAYPDFEKFALHSVRHIATGMDFFSPALWERLKIGFPALREYTNGYGLIETSNVILMKKSLAGDVDEFSVNQVTIVMDTDIEIDVRNLEGEMVTEGILWVKGPSVISGYLSAPEENAKLFVDGWFNTGDRVRRGSDNTVILLGREKYIIKRGGRSVSPTLISDMINTIPGILDSVVVGVPHPLYGEMIWAFVVEKTIGSVTLNGVMRECRKLLPSWSAPDQVRFIEAIPKNPGIGKVATEKLILRAKEELVALEQGSKNG